MLTAQNLNDGNDETKPQRIVPVYGRETITASGWTRVFRRASSSVIALRCQ